MSGKKISVNLLASVSCISPEDVTALRVNPLENSLVLPPINNQQAEAPHPILVARDGSPHFSLFMDRPGHSWCLSNKNPKGAAAIARQLHREGRVGHYLHAVPAVAESVVDAWEKAGGTVSRLAFRYAVMAERSIPRQNSTQLDGYIDAPSLDDLTTLAERSWSFYQNTMNEHATLSSQRVWIASAIRQGGMKVWRKDGEIMAQGAFPDPSKTQNDFVNFSMIATNPTLSFNDQAKYARLLLSSALQEYGSKTFFTYADDKNPMTDEVYRALGLKQEATILRYDGLYPAGQKSHERFSHYPGA